MIPPSLIQKYNIPVPRYTSYPPASAWKSIDEQAFLTALTGRVSSAPLSLYLHIPFCQTICSYCGCSTMANRDPTVEKRYVNSLLQEISLLQSTVGHAHVHQIHFGGGTPSKLADDQLAQLMSSLRSAFHIDNNAEIAIEIDPRTVYGSRSSLIKTLKDLGFTRLSLGIQDLNDTVQQAIGRRQSEEVSTAVYRTCQAAGFGSINLDLVYGLPGQTPSSFLETISTVISLRPDRIALFSFAYLPEIRPNQKTLPAALLPSTEEKFLIYSTAREALLRNGYRAIGLDHFALPEDPLSTCLLKGTLHRNFQGYTVSEGNEVIGLGMTGISDLRIGYFQKAKTLADYSHAINEGRHAITKGILLSDDDQRRRWVIEQIMCQGRVCKADFFRLWDRPFDDFFASSYDRLQPLICDGLVESTSEYLTVTSTGSLFLRNFASCFDVSLSSFSHGSRAI